MNDIQLYELYCSIPKWSVTNRSRIYPKYVVITGRTFSAPHPHRHYSFEEFVDKLNEDPKFRNVILNTQIMKTEYPYYVVVKVNAGQLVKVYRDKKFKSYNDCYDSFQGWASTYHKSFSNGQYAIVEYTASYECRIITIFTNTVEIKLV